MKNYPIILLVLGTLFSCTDKDMKYDASGVFEATEVMVSAKSAGELLQFDILEGQNLKAYETVGYIDTIQLHLQKEQLEANLLSVESRHYDVSTQIASIRQQISTQKKEQKRFEDLVRNNAANQKQLDDINEQIKLLEKQLSAKEETLIKGNESVYGDIKSLTAQIELIKDQIKKSIICSPINGTVLTKYMEKGELAVQGKALFKVADMENIYLRAYITADQLTTLKIGQEVKVYADQGKSDRKEYKGTVTWISDKAEFTPKTIQTRDERANLVYAVKVMVRNDGYIKRGMYGELKIN
jgi:HlyD family secretion protein